MFPPMADMAGGLAGMMGGGQGSPGGPQGTEPEESFVDLLAQRKLVEDFQKQSQERQKRLEAMLMQGPGDVRKQHTEEYYGVKPGETPGKGRQAKKWVEEFLSAVTQGPKYVSARDRVRQDAEKDYQLQTSRLAQAVSNDRAQATEMNYMQRDLQTQAALKQKSDALSKTLAAQKERNDTTNFVKFEAAKMKEAGLKDFRDLKEKLAGLDRDLKERGQDLRFYKEGLIDALAVDEKGEFDPKMAAQIYMYMNQKQGGGSGGTTSTSYGQTVYRERADGGVDKIVKDPVTRVTRPNNAGPQLAAGFGSFIDQLKGQQPGGMMQTPSTQGMQMPQTQGQGQVPTSLQAPLAQMMGRGGQSGSSASPLLDSQGNPFLSKQAGEQLRTDQGVNTRFRQLASGIGNEYTKWIRSGKNSQVGLGAYTGPNLNTALGQMGIRAAIGKVGDMEALIKPESIIALQKQILETTGKAFSLPEKGMYDSYWPSLSLMKGPEAVAQASIALALLNSAAYDKMRIGYGVKLGPNSKAVPGATYLGASSINLQPAIEKRMTQLMAKLNKGENLTDLDFSFDKEINDEIDRMKLGTVIKPGTSTPPPAESITPPKKGRPSTQSVFDKNGKQSFRIVHTPE